MEYVTHKRDAQILHFVRVRNERHIWQQNSNQNDALVAYKRGN